MVRQIANSRLFLPEPFLAWVCIGGGVVVIAFGTLAAIQVRRHMWGEARGLLESLVSANRDTWHYWLHDYDEPDKWAKGLMLVLRVPAGIVTLWGVAGLAI